MTSDETRFIKKARKLFGIHKKSLKSKKTFAACCSHPF